MMLTLIAVLGVWLFLLVMVVGLCRAAATTEAAVSRSSRDERIPRFSRDPVRPRPTVLR